MTGPLTHGPFATASLGHVAEVTLGKMVQSTPSADAALVPYIKARNVRPERVDLESLDLMYATHSERDHLNVREGDIFVIEGGATAGRAAVVTDPPPGDCVFQNAVHRVRAKPTADQRFLYYVLTAYPGTGWYDAVCSAATFKHLTGEKMSVLPVPLPPVDTQLRIADVLDVETARIDTLIEKNERASGLAQLKLRETIATAVTRGIAGGSERAVDAAWAMAINDAWSWAPYQYYAELGTGHTPSRSDPTLWEDCNVPWVTTADVKHLRSHRREYLDETEHHLSERGLANSAARWLPARTVVLSRTASVGFSAVVTVPTATSQDFFTWTCDEGRLHPEYLLHVLRAMKFRGHFDRLMYGSTHKTIYFPDLVQLRGPLPPVPEQRKIVDHVREQGAGVQSLRERMSRMNELLRLRRQALITAAVTGQIEV